MPACLPVNVRQRRFSSAIRWAREKHFLSNADYAPKWREC
jgi:hypothetical protein